jgi:hypothetical protein
VRGITRAPNKRMKLARLSAAPGTHTRGATAWARRRGAGATASQRVDSLIRWGALFSLAWLMGVGSMMAVMCGL